MGRAKTRWPKNWMIADLLKELGGIPPERIRLRPWPGTAKEEDVTWLQDHEDRTYELIDGVLVLKDMGLKQSFLAVEIARQLGNFVKERGVGFVTGPDGTLKLTPGLVRIPDVSFISWDRVPSRTIPDEAIPLLPPDLAVEVISPSNTRGEMERKLREYFFHGVTRVWLAYFEERRIDVYSSPEDFTRVGEDEVLTGDPVLPGFRVTVRDLFEELPFARPPAAPKKGRKKRGA